MRQMLAGILLHVDTRVYFRGGQGVLLPPPLGFSLPPLGFSLPPLRIFSTSDLRSLYLSPTPH